MKKRIAVVGKGTAGSQAVIHFLRHMPDWDVQWHYDPNIPTQSVGEGSSLGLPRNLFQCLNFNYFDLSKIDATMKLGIYKVGWGKNNKPFMHDFPPPNASIHFNAKALQKYVYDSVKDKVEIIEHSINSENVDADYVLDCSGRPKSYTQFNKSSYIPVNAAYITQCYWDLPRFQYTLMVARPYGWVFGIPLQHRCSIGYMFNRNINNVEEIKEDVKNIFSEYNLIPSEDTNYIEFENYYRKSNYGERVTYSGNASFFLEPLEATSIYCMDQVQRNVFDILTNSKTPDQCNFDYIRMMQQIEVMIMMHYFSGSSYDTEFWKFAKQRGNDIMRIALNNDNDFSMNIKYALQVRKSNFCEDIAEYASWWPGSFCQNIEGLGIENDLIKLLNI
jgi:hypothetical protein